MVGLFAISGIHAFALNGVGLGLALTSPTPSALCSVSSGSGNGDDEFIGGSRPGKPRASTVPLGSGPLTPPGPLRPSSKRDEDTELIKTLPARQLNYAGFLKRLNEMDEIAKTKFVTEHFEGHNDDLELGPEYINTVISRGPKARFVSVAIKYYDASFNPEAYARSPAEVRAFAMHFQLPGYNLKLLIATRDVSEIHSLHEGTLNIFRARRTAKAAYEWLYQQITAMAPKSE